jgi:hypothetical protein
MKQTVRATVVQIENESGEHPAVVLQCSGDIAISPKASVTARAILCDQEVLIVGPDRVNVRGKGKPTVEVGDIVEIEVTSDTTA